MAITNLSVINAMLGSLGMTALTANDSSHPRYIQAQAKIDEIDGELQNMGWWFNKTVETLSANGAGEIPFSSTAIHVDPTDRTLTYVMRDLKLYDLVDATFIIGIGSSVECNVVYQLPFEELPPMMQVHLKNRARYDFYLDQDGSEPKLTKYAELAAQSWVKLKQEHNKNQDINFFEGSHGTWFRTAFHPNSVNRNVARQPG
jgi:hypothetical protein